MHLCWRLFCLLLICATAACRAPELPEVAPEAILGQAAERMRATTGFHFVIERTGAPAFLDPDGVLAFRRAEGDFVAPDRAQAIVRVIAPGLVTDVSVISVAEVQWQTNVLTGQWEALPPDWGFNPAILVDEEIGLPVMLEMDVSEVTLVGTETITNGPDGRFYHLTGRVAGERLHLMSSGLIGPDPVEAVFWIAPETFELVRVIITDASAAADEPTVWQIDFSAFDQVVAIEPPG